MEKLNGLPVDFSSGISTFNKTSPDFFNYDFEVIENSPVSTSSGVVEYYPDSSLSDKEFESKFNIQTEEQMIVSYQAVLELVLKVQRLKLKVTQLKLLGDSREDQIASSKEEIESAVNLLIMRLDFFTISGMTKSYYTMRKVLYSMLDYLEANLELVDGDIVEFVELDDWMSAKSKKIGVILGEVLKIFDLFFIGNSLTKDKIDLKNRELKTPRTEGIKNENEDYLECESNNSDEKKMNGIEETDENLPFDRDCKVPSVLYKFIEVRKNIVRLKDDDYSVKLGRRLIRETGNLKKKIILFRQEMDDFNVDVVESTDVQGPFKRLLESQLNSIDELIQIMDKKYEVVLSGKVNASKSGDLEENQSQESDNPGNNEIRNCRGKYSTSGSVLFSKPLFEKMDYKQELMNRSIVCHANSLIEMTKFFDQLFYIFTCGKEDLSKSVIT